MILFWRTLANQQVVATLDDSTSPKKKRQKHIFPHLNYSLLIQKISRVSLSIWMNTLWSLFCCFVLCLCTLCTIGHFFFIDWLLKIEFSRKRVYVTAKERARELSAARVQMKTNEKRDWIDFMFVAAKYIFFSCLCWCI